MHWRITSKAAWTSRLIQDARRWTERTLILKIPLTFHITQALTGHGCFQYYLHHMSRAISTHCLDCFSTSDTAEHTLFQFPRWDAMRADVHAHFARPSTAEDMPDLLCGPVFSDLPTDMLERATTVQRLKNLIQSSISQQRTSCPSRRTKSVRGNSREIVI